MTEQTENSTRLLWRQQEQLAQRHWLMVNTLDAAAVALPGKSSLFHLDLASRDNARIPAAKSQFSLLPMIPENTDLLVLLLPKSGEKLDMLLHSLAAAILSPIEIWLVGPSKGGIKGGMTRLKKMASEVAVRDSARHYKLVSATLQPTTGFSLDSFRKEYLFHGEKIVSWPGVFSHGKLDQGTELLLQQLEKQIQRDGGIEGKPVLDMGCGAGILTVALARARGRVTAVDASVAATCATASSLEANGLQAKVIHSDLFAGVTGQFDQIWTNPPFHHGKVRTTDTTLRLIEQAPAFLYSGGQLTLVCNHGLGYRETMKKYFGNVELLEQTPGYQIFQSFKRS